MSNFRWRSMSKGLNDGATDGKYVKNRPNTEALASNNVATLGDKATLNPRDGYSAGESPVMWKPDGTRA
jgi:hypothetical protein